MITQKRVVVMVCGDAVNMAKDVRTTIRGMLEEAFDDSQANDYITEMVNQRRYIEDIWT